MADLNLIRMYIIFLVIVISFVLSFKHFKHHFRSIKKHTWIILLILFVLALLLRLSVPHYYKLYMDEPRYVEVAKNIVLHDKAQILKYYGSSEFRFFEPFQPIGWPFLISLAFRLFGIDGFVATYLNTAISSFTVFLVFILAYLLFERENVGLWAALLLALNPLHIHWSTSAGVNAPSLFFMVLALIAFVMYCRTSYVWLHVLATFSFLFSVLFRLEYILLLVLIFLVYFLYRKKIKDEIKGAVFWIPWLAILIFYKNYYSTLALFLNKLQINIGAQQIISDTGSFGIASVPSNLLMLFKYLVSVFGPLLLVFLLIGGCALLFKNRKMLLFIIAWLALFSGFYLSYYSFQLRHLLFPILALNFLVAFGIDYLTDLKQTKRYRIFLVIALVMLIVLFIQPHIAPLYAVNDADYLQTKIPEIAEERVPLHCFITTSRPALISSSTSLKVIPLDFFLSEPSVFRDLEGSCVLYYDGSYMSSQEFDNLTQSYVLEKFLEFNKGRTRFTIYNITAKS